MAYHLDEGQAPTGTWPSSSGDVRAERAGAGMDEAQWRLLSSIARRFYLEDASKTELADEFSISRFRVARLLQQETRLPERMVDPTAFEFVDVHAEADLGTGNLFEHGVHFAADRQQPSRADDRKMLCHAKDYRPKF